MKKALCVLAILTLAVTATASVRVFVTPASAGAGLNESWNAFVPTFSTVDVDNNNYDALDYYNSVGAGAGDGIHGFSIAAYPAQTAPSGTLANPILIDPPDFGYIWFQFQAETKARKVNGLKVLINDISGPTAVETTYYLQNDVGGVAGFKRWDGTATPTAYPEFVNQNPQTLVGVDAAGIVNAASDVPWNMYKKQAGTGTNPYTGVTLIGAVKGQAGHTYEITLLECNYSSGALPERFGGVFKFPPEPASLVLMALAGLMLRRR